MPRPEMSDEYFRELQEAAEASFDAPDLPSMFKLPEFREFYKILYMAGEWLKGELVEMGMDEKQAEDVGFAFGQRCFGKPDPWEVAKEQLARYKSGRVDVPGEKLALELIGDMQNNSPEFLAAMKKELHAKFTKFV